MCQGRVRCLQVDVRGGGEARSDRDEPGPRSAPAPTATSGGGDGEPQRVAEGPATTGGTGKLGVVAPHRGYHDGAAPFGSPRAAMAGHRLWTRQAHGPAHVPHATRQGAVIERPKSHRSHRPVTLDRGTLGTLVLNTVPPERFRREALRSSQNPHARPGAPVVPSASLCASSLRPHEPRQEPR